MKADANFLFRRSTKSRHPEIQQSSRLWHDDTDWPLYNKATKEYYVSQQHYQHDKQALWSYLLTHIDSDVDHLIKLHPEYAEAVDNLDTKKLWIILRQSVKNFVSVALTTCM